MRSRTILAGMVVVLALVGTAFYVATHAGTSSSALPEECTARLGPDSVTLSLPQAANAAVIAAVAERRGLPARAVSIALTAAIQESKLFNLHYGDSDSLGLFQQRPSQGWGTPSQVLDPVYASNAFYDALEHVSGYQTMGIGKAAQEVQRSAFPTAYDEHETVGRALASALTGWSPGAFSCRIHQPAVSVSSTLVGGLTTSAVAVRTAARNMFGSVTSGPVAPGDKVAVDAGGTLLLAARDGRALTLAPPHASVPTSVAAWGLAAYLVAHAGRLHIAEVHVGGRYWTAGDGTPAWRHDPAANDIAGGEVLVAVT